MLCGIKSQYLSLIYKDVLHRKVEENRSTHYSLTRQFKDSLDIHKKKYPTIYIEKTLSLLQFSEYPDSFGSEADSEKTFEIIDESSDDKET
jgi:hypothetical protein